PWEVVPYRFPSAPRTRGAEGLEPLVPWNKVSGVKTPLVVIRNTVPRPLGLFLVEPPMLVVPQRLPSGPKINLVKGSWPSVEWKLNKVVRTPLVVILNMVPKPKSPPNPVVPYRLPSRPWTRPPRGIAP